MGSSFSSSAAVERDVLTYSVLFEFGLNENPLSKLVTDKELATAYGYGIVQASSADGDFGDTEKDWCRGILLRRGISLPLTSMILTTESKITVTEIASKLNSRSLSNDYKMIFLYDLVEAASVDGLSEPEKRYVSSMANALGLAHDIVNDIISVVEKEESLMVQKITELKILYFEGLMQKFVKFRDPGVEIFRSTNPDVERSRFHSEYLRQLNAFMGMTLYGADLTLNKEMLTEFFSAVVAVSSADGFSNKEREFLRYWFRLAGAPSFMITMFLNFPPKRSVDKVVTTFKASTNPGEYVVGSRFLIYFGCLIASVDGFSVEEFTVLSSGLTTETCNKIFDIVGAEDDLKMTRIKVLQLQNHPALNENYYDAERRLASTAATANEESLCSSSSIKNSRSNFIFLTVVVSGMFVLVDSLHSARLFKM